MKYQIYQVKQDHLREVAFWPLESLDTLGIKLDMEKYARVYEGEIAVAEPLEVLEKLFETFNLEHPSDFQGRSMSVSDIVVLDGVSWYCDSFGWKEVAV